MTHMTIFLARLLHVIISMSHVKFKKSPCCCVDLRVYTNLCARYVGGT